MAVENKKRSAIILVGGHGTRLRPLTLSMPKPLIPFANKPILFHQIDFLYKEGVTRIILATNNKEVLKEALKCYDRYENLEILFSIEERPLGTAGPLLLAKDLVTYPCYLLNSDIICKFPLSQLMTYHLKHKRVATLLATTVKDPSRYGVLNINEDDMSIISFIEKPKEYVGNRINAGVYVIEERITEYIKRGECSIEKDVFPVLAKQNELTYYDLNGFWMDIGQPRDYLEGVRLFLTKGLGCHDNMCITDSSHYFNKNHENVSFDDLKKETNIDFYNFKINNSFTIVASLVDNSAKIGIGSMIGPNVVIGKNVRIGNYVRIIDSTIMDGAVIEDGCYVKYSIVGWKAVIRKWARIENYTVLGEQVEIGEGISLTNCVILPNKKIVTSSTDCILL